MKVPVLSCLEDAACLELMKVPANQNASAGMIGFGLVDFCNCPAPLAVLTGGVLGVIAWAAHAH